MREKNLNERERKRLKSCCSSPGLLLGVNPHLLMMKGVG